MNKKYTQEIVEKIFKDGDCELLDIFTKVIIPMKYKCVCGNESKINFHNFKNGQRCKQCAKEKIRKKCTHSQEYMDQQFKDQGCELLDIYIKNDIPLKYKCVCGNISKITLINFKKGKRCRKCGNNDIHTQQKVEEYFKLQGCELLDIYINSKTNMMYCCSCENISNISWNSFRNGNRCIKCSGKEKHSQDYVKQYFKEQNCELLDIYKNNRKNMKYRCTCGNESKICFSSFQSGTRCKQCGINKMKEKISGINCHWWNPDRNKKRKIKELQSLSKSYRNKFRKKYNISKEFDIDHIFPIKAYVDYGVFDIELMNLEENLQPLTPYYNRHVKKDKYNKQKFEKYLRSKGYKIYVVKEQ